MTNVLASSTKELMASPNMAQTDMAHPDMAQIQPELAEQPTWRDLAACKDANIDFFPFPEDVQAIGRAKEVCATCPVAEECLAYALETRQGDGIWGGHTPKERMKIRRKWMEQVRRAS